MASVLSIDFIDNSVYWSRLAGPRACWIPLRTSGAPVDIRFQLRADSRVSAETANSLRIYEGAYRRPGHPGHSRGASRLMRLLGRLLGRLLYRVRVEGLENFPTRGPTLALVKHQRNEDIPLGFAYILTERRPDSWCVMKHDLAAPHLFGFVLKSGGIPIDRDRPMRSRRYFRMAREVLHDGRSLVLFPEQTFFVNEMGPGKLPGFRYLTKHAPDAIRVVSVGLEYVTARSRGRLIGRTEAIFRIGVPEELPVHISRDQDSQARFLHERMQAIARLTNLEYLHASARRPAGQLRRMRD